MRSITRTLLVRPEPWVATGAQLEWVQRRQFSIHHPARTLGFMLRSELQGVTFTCPSCNKQRAVIQTRGVAHQLLCRNVGCWSRWVVDQYMMRDLLKNITREITYMETVKQKQWQLAVRPYRLPDWALQRNNIWDVPSTPERRIPVETWSFAMQTVT